MLFPCLQSFSLKISFLASFPKSEDNMRVRLEFRRHWNTYANVGGKFYFSCLGSISLDVKLKILTFIHDLNIAHRASTLSVYLLTEILKFPCAVSVTFFCATGIQSHWAR
jgi:hypothetical protein